MKKAMSIILSALIIFSCLFIVGAADSGAISTDYRYTDRFNLALLSYNDFSLITEEYYAVPGLENTVLTDGESCNCMTPQGLCATEDFLFISAYCGVKRYKTDLEENINFGKNKEKLQAEENHGAHKSVIYILDRETGAYLKTLVLPDKNHVGGLATDGKNIFLAKSTDKQVSVITAAQISLAMATKSYTVKANYDFTFDCDCTASFVTYFDGILWVGVFDEKKDGELNGFEFDILTGLRKVASVAIPKKANGASFTEIDGDICLNINSSYGRKNVSDIHLYSVSDYGKESMTLEKKGAYKTPPTVQNSAIYDGKVYFIYESAATCYSQVDSLFEIKSTSMPVDRVCIGDAENLFKWHNDNIFFERISAFVRAVKNLADNLF